MKVKSIAECSLGAFCNTFDLHLVIIGLENQFLVFLLSGCLRQALLISFLEVTCCLLIIFASNLDPDQELKTSVLICIQTVLPSGSVPERILEKKKCFGKSQRTTTRHEKIFNMQIQVVNF